MPIYVLTTRHVEAMASNGCVVELEDILVRECDATLIEPHRDEEPPRRWVLQPVRLDGARADRVLVVVALYTGLANVLDAIAHWRDHFGCVAIYVMDPWGAWTKWPQKVPRNADFYFVPDVRVAQQWSQAHGVNAIAVPMGADVLTFGSRRLDRPLDLVAYGRQAGTFSAALEQAFNDPRSNRFMYVDTFTAPRVRDFAMNRRLIWKLLHKSRLALAFDLLQTPEVRDGDRYRSIIPLRYYEGVTAGVAIVGHHPVVPEMAAQFGWTDATIALPQSPADAVPFVEELLSDTARLRQITLRNHEHAWRLHDWRYRLRDMFTHMGVALPPRLARALQVLQGPPLDCADVPPY